jgi:hypothetical protein
VKIDSAGVAYRVPNGTGTHLIHINGDEEMFIEEKVSLTNAVFTLSKYTIFNALPKMKPHTTAYLDMESDIAPPSYPGSLIEMPCPAAKPPVDSSSLK